MTPAELHAEAPPTSSEAANLGARLSRVLAAADDATMAVAAETCLEELAGFAGADRAYLAVFNHYARVSEHWTWNRSDKPFKTVFNGSLLDDLVGAGAAFLRIGRTLAVGNNLGALELTAEERRHVEENGGLPAAALVIPVLVEGDLAGIVNLQSMDEPRAWAPQLLAEVEAFAELVVKMLGRTQQRQELAAANARARRIADFLPDGLLMLATDGAVVWVSPSFSAMSGLSPEELEHRPFAELVSESDRGALLEQLDALSAGADASLAVRIADPHGQWRWADLSLRLASEPGSGAPDEIVVTVRDTHDRHLREMQLVRKSDRDSLTGLANRGAFDRFVSELASSGATAMVAFCDVDDFKRFNDDLGHEHGDEILRQVARAIERAVRSIDMVARIGGDEFVVVVVDPRQDAATLGDRLVEAVRDRETDGGPLTMSVGIAGPGPAPEARHLVRLADEAMYSAKRAGKDGWVRASAAATEASLGP